MESLKLDKDKKIPFETHTEHHIFIHKLMDDKEKTDDIKHKAFSTIVVAGVLSAFSGLGAIVWYAIKSFIEKGGH